MVLTASWALARRIAVTKSAVNHSSEYWARAMSSTAAAAVVRKPPPDGSVVGTAGWPPGLQVFNAFGSPSPRTAKGVVDGSRELIAAVEAAAKGTAEGARSAAIPQPVRSRAHNLAAERDFVPLRVSDPLADQTARVMRRCEHFAEYGSSYHSLTYFRGNRNVPSVMDPILAALRELDVIRALAPKGAASKGGDALGLHWKLTLNHYRARPKGESLAAAGGALFPWHTDLAANGEITAIATLLAPATLEFAPHADLGAAERPTRVVAAPGSLVLLSGPARWDWVHRAQPHEDADGQERISLVLGCAPVADRF